MPSAIFLLLINGILKERRFHYYEWFPHQTLFQKKLLLSFIVLSFIPVLLIGITTYRLYNRFITDMTEKSSVETIDLICNDIDSLLNDTWQLCDALTRDIKIQENLRVKFNSVSSQYSWIFPEAWIWLPFHLPQRHFRSICFRWKWRPL